MGARACPIFTAPPTEKPLENPVEPEGLGEPSLKRIGPDAPFQHGTLGTASQNRGAMNPLSGTPGPRNFCETTVMPRMRNQLSPFSPEERKGDEPWRLQEGLGIDYIPGKVVGGMKRRKVQSCPGLGRMPSSLTEDELSSSGQGRGQLQRQRGGLSGLLRRALPLQTSFDSVVWEDLGAAWAFCSSPNSHVVRGMFGNYTIC